jgi:hypothetical protein
MARHAMDRQGHNQWPVEQNADVLWRLVVDRGLPIATQAGDLAIAAFRRGRLQADPSETRAPQLYAVHALAVPAWEVGRVGGRTAFEDVLAPPRARGPYKRPIQNRLSGLLVVHGVRGIVNGGDPAPIDGEASYSLFSNGEVRLTDEVRPEGMSDTDYRTQAANMLADLAMPDVQLPPWSVAAGSLASEVIGRSPFVYRGAYPFADIAMRDAVSQAIG